MPRGTAYPRLVFPPVHQWILVEELKYMEHAMGQGRALCPQDQAPTARGDTFAPKYLLRAGRNLP